MLADIFHHLVLDKVSSNVPTVVIPILDIAQAARLSCFRNVVSPTTPIPHYTVPTMEPLTPQLTSPAIHRHTMSAAERSKHWHDFMWKTLVGKSWEVHKADDPDCAYHEDDQNHNADTDYDANVESILTHFDSTRIVSLETPIRAMSKDSAVEESRAIKMAIMTWIIESKER